jgi:cysteine-rich repeat protein
MEPMCWRCWFGLIVAVFAACKVPNAVDGDGQGQARCGDGIVSDNEVCDDGNTIAGDGCSASCASDESCGNSVVDEDAGETMR